MSDVLPRATRLRDGAVPKHVQLRDLLATAAREQLSPHASVGSERELMATYGVSRATVRAAIGQLVSEGVLYRVQGKGTFVAEKRIEAEAHLASFTQDMRRRGLEPTTEVLETVVTTAPPSVTSNLGLTAAEQVWRVERLRIAGGSPMALEVSWYPHRLLPDLDQHDLAASVYTLLSRTYRLAPDSATQTVWAESADEDQARRLGIRPGAPLLTFRRTTTSHGLPIEQTTSWYRGDRYQVQMSLGSGPTAPRPT